MYLETTHVNGTSAQPAACPMDDVRITTKSRSTTARIFEELAFKRLRSSVPVLTAAVAPVQMSRIPRTR
jgi:hypothetical protein